MSRHIHCEDSWGSLCDGHDIDELTFAQPALLLYDLVLHHGDHSIATSDRAYPDPKEDPEEP